MDNDYFGSRILYMNPEAWLLQIAFPHSENGYNYSLYLPVDVRIAWYFSFCRSNRVRPKITESYLGYELTASGAIITTKVEVYFDDNLIAESYSKMFCKQGADFIGVVQTSLNEAKGRALSLAGFNVPISENRMSHNKPISKEDENKIYGVNKNEW